MRRPPSTSRPSFPSHPLLILLILLLSLCSSSAFRLPRLFSRDIEPKQIVGLYRNVPLGVEATLGTKCPDAIDIASVEVQQSNLGVLIIIPHRRISLPQEGGTRAQCVPNPVDSEYSPESATVLRRDKDIVPLDDRNPVVAAFKLAGERFYLGFELGDRVCGLLNTPENTVSMWMAPERRIAAPIPEFSVSVNFQPGSKYVYYFDDNAPCLFKGNAAQIGVVTIARTPTPSPTPTSSITPTPTPSAEESPLPLLPPLPPATPVLSASPSASAPSVALPPTGSTGGGGPAVNSVDSVSARPACFPATARVLLADGSSLAMVGLRVGARVQTEYTKDAFVLGFSHSWVTARTYMVGIRTISNRTAVASEGHWIVMAEGKMKRMRDVDAGDVVVDVKHGKTRVIATWREWTTGVFNPHTDDGTIVVDGLVFSTYTDAVGNVAAGHAVMAPVRAAVRSFVGAATWLDGARCRWAPGSYSECWR